MYHDRNINFAWNIVNLQMDSLRGYHSLLVIKYRTYQAGTMVQMIKQNLAFFPAFPSISPNQPCCLFFWLYSAAIPVRDMQMLLGA